MAFNAFEQAFNSSLNQQSGFFGQQALGGITGIGSQALLDELRRSEERARVSTWSLHEMEVMYNRKEAKQKIYMTYRDELQAEIDEWLG